jgi:predicted DNA-binding transcriptional regulator YafY
MYEKPQYLTPDGYRRSPKNPFTEKDKSAAANALQLLRERKRELLAASTAKTRPKLALSEEAAKLIAQAISGMLRSK